MKTELIIRIKEISNEVVGIIRNEMSHYYERNIDMCKGNSKKKCGGHYRN